MGKVFKVHGREWTEEYLRSASKKLGSELGSRTAAVKMVEGDRILDLGCGMGLAAAHLAQKHKEVVGIDILPEAIKTANELFSQPNLKFKVCDVTKRLEFADDYFNTVLLLEVIEHLDNPVKTLEEAYRVLKQGGVLIISTPNGISYSSVLRQSILNLEKEFKKIDSEPVGGGTNYDHLYSWDVFTLYRLLQRCRFKYVEHKFAGVYGLGLLKHLKNLNFLSPLLNRNCATIIMKVRKPLILETS